MNTAKKISDICTEYRIADLYVFGSRSEEIAARARSQKIKFAENARSDVDIAVLPVDASRFGPFERVSLAIAIEDLFDVSRVDLIVLPEADPFLALEIIRGELLYTDDPDRQARHELYILRRAGDLIPFKKERIRMIMEESAR